MSFRRRTYVLLVLAVIVASIATHAFRPGGQAGTACGIRDITLAVEVCPTTDVDAILGEIGSETRAQLHDQTLVDFALIAAYVALWVATGLALNPGVAILAGLAGVADVVENLAILTLAFSLPIGDPNHMPVTRDLSEGRRALILKWMTSPGPDGLPLKGAPVAIAAAPPMQAAPEPVRLGLAPLQTKGKTAVMLAYEARRKGAGPL